MAPLEIVVRALAVVVGGLLVAASLRSAIRTFILPRGGVDPIVRGTFLWFRRALELLVSRDAAYTRRDRVMAYYAPVGLVISAAVWIVLVLAGFTLVYWAAGDRTLPDAFRESGSSLLTLGFSPPNGPLETLLSFVEAAIGLALAALLVAYLPTVYAAFARRELAVNLLEVRADSPPSAVAMLARFYRLGRLDALHEEWIRWEAWFADIEESHTSIAALPFYRSPTPDQSWITAAGVVMDAAAIARSLLDIPKDIQADLMIRAGYVSLRRIADYFQIAYDRSPARDSATSVTRAMFDTAADELAAAGLPLRDDREAAFLDYNGWRVNYDHPLLALSQLVVAPPARWNGPTERAGRSDMRIRGRDPR